MSGADRSPTAIMHVDRPNLEVLTRDDVAARVASLLDLDLTDRDAAALGAEQLRCDVLGAVAGGAPDSIFLAQLALLTVEQDIGGKRSGLRGKLLAS